MHHLYTLILSTLKMHKHMACINRSRNTHHLLLSGSTKHHLDTLTLLLSLLDINLGWNDHASLHVWTYLKKILHYGSYWFLAICLGILHMEHSSCSTTVLDERFHSSNAQQCHWKGLHSLHLQWFWPASAIHIRRNIIWSLHDHLKWCFWMRAHLKRYRIWKWE